MQKHSTIKGADKQDRAKEILEGIVNLFESGQAPTTIVKSVIAARATDRPSARWSIGNRLIQMIMGTEDARGYQQWQEVSRQVKKGAKAVWILAPNTKTIAERKEDGEEEKRVIITGFRYIPVFRYEDTDGEPLPAATSYRPAELPPLYSVAVAMGINVDWQPFNGREYGSMTIDGKHMVLRTHEVSTFFHELGHEAHSRTNKRPTRGGQDPLRETVAQMISATLSELYGYPDTLGYTWQYVKGYAHDDPVAAIRQILAVLNEIEAAVNLVLDIEAGTRTAAEAA